MINQHLIEPMARAYRVDQLAMSEHFVTDELVLANRTFGYRIGAKLVALGSHLMRVDMEDVRTTRIAA